MNVLLEQRSKLCELDEEEEMLLMSYVELYKARREDAWFLDSGCSNHMCGDRTMFNELDENFRHSVKLGNNTKLDVTGKGSVKLLLNGVNHVVTEVYYIPELRNNLLSIGQLQERGLAILIKGGMCKIFHPEKGLIIQTNMCANRMFILLPQSQAPSQVQSDQCFHTRTQDLSHLWHRRYGHLSYKGLRTLLYKNMVRGLPQLSASSVTCTDCINGKQHRDPIPKKSTWRATQKLELIHADICGPITPTSNSNKRCPTLAVKDVTPEETWSGVKPSIDHFRVFGCIAHVHVPEERRTKLDNRSITCVLLGVSEESKGYRLFDPVAKRVVVSRDVIFEEEKQWDWDVSYEKQIVVDLEWGDGDGENEEGVSENGNRENTDGEVGGTCDTEVIEEEDSSSEGEERVRELRQSRERQPPTWMGDYVSGEGLSEDEVHMALVESTDPLHFEEAVKSVNWRLAMNSEIKSIEKNQTWTLTELPAGAKRIGVKWVYKTKYNEHGQIDKYKARLVAKGYSQKYGVDYTEVFAPVARMDTIRMIIALAAQKNWTIFQLDVKSAFLHGELSEDVYVEQPRGYEKKGSEHLVYKLHKALYGLKQAPRAWFSRIEAHFIGEGFFLGIEVLQKSDGIYICQRKYALEVLRRFGMMESNSVGSPIVPGFKISKDENGDSVDETYYKQLVGRDGELLAFTDSDYAGDMEDRKSTSGYVFLMSSGAVSWCSKKQPIVTLSTTEAEFVAAAVCACQGVWMKRILKELGHSNGSCTTVMCDNSSTIKLSKNPVMHGRSKHIDVRFHFLRNLTKEGTIELVHCGSQDQVADI
ncbi:unnamed protein product, partial [Prunus brigantina]